MEYFEVRDAHAYSDDQTLDFLYDLRHRDIEWDVFYKRFSNDIHRFNQTDNPYMSFLARYYPSIEIFILPDDEEMEANSTAYRRILSMDIEPVHSSSYVYDTFMRINGFSMIKKLLSWDWSEEIWPACKGELFYWDADYDTSYDYLVLLSNQQVIHVWDLDDFKNYDKGEENIAGFHITVRTDNVLESTDSGRALYALLNDDKFPLKEEYDLLCGWVHKLGAVQTNRGKGASLTQMLGIEPPPKT